MASEEDDTTYRYVEPSSRSPSKRKAAKTVRAGEAPIEPDEDAPVPSSEPESDIAPSRNKLGVKDLEPLMERGQYDKVCELLGPAERASELPPKLALLYIVARAELGEGAELADLPHLAMVTCGKVLGLPPRSRASRLFAKRLLGLSSTDIRRRMPTAPMRLALIALGLVLGVFVGWIAGIV